MTLHSSWCCFRFSLRGMLLLVAAMCVYLGTQVYQYREYARTDQFIRQAGGGIGYGYAQSSGEGSTFSEPQSSWVYRLLVGLTQEDQISSLALYDDRMSGGCNDQFLSQLAAQKDRLSNLREITFNGGSVTSRGVGHIAVFRQLEYLDLSNTRIDDACVPLLERLENLKSLNLNGTDVSADGMAKLRKRLPHCKTIR